MKKFFHVFLMVATLAFIGGTATAQDTAESEFRFEAHGGIGLPTFDIADAAEAGPLGGVGFWYTPANAMYSFGFEGDFGFHTGADVEVEGETMSGPDVNVYHFMGKGGYHIYASDDAKLRLMVNAGVGAVMFDVDVEGADSETYLAINAGGKLFYALSPQIDFVVSLQGDIAFSDEEVLGTSNAWVWPLAVGISFRI